MDERPPYIGYHFAEFVMMGLALITLLGLIIKNNKNSKVEYRYIFSCYLVGTLIQECITLLYEYVSFITEFADIDKISANVFTLFEFILFSYFFLLVIKIPLAKKIIQINLCGFSAFCILYWLIPNNITKFPYQISTVECFLMIAYCLIYFFELFNNFSQQTLIPKPPSFWIVTGMLVYFICIIPMFLILGIVPDGISHYYDDLHYINFLSCSIFYISMIKAFLWKTMRTA